MVVVLSVLVPGEIPGSPFFSPAKLLHLSFVRFRTVLVYWR